VFYVTIIFDMNNDVQNICCIIYRRSFMKQKLCDFLKMRFFLFTLQRKFIVEARGLYFNLI